MSLSLLLASALSLATASEAEPVVALTAHPLGWLLLPVAGDETGTITHVQLDAVAHPVASLAPTAHLAWTLLRTDIDQLDDFDRSSIDRYTLELGARWRPSPDRGWYLEGTLGWLLETYDSRWMESVEFNRQTNTSTHVLFGEVDNTFQQPYAMLYAGWASDPSRRLRWDFGIGLGWAFLGGTETLHDIAWSGDLTRIGDDQSVDLFAAAPLVLDVNFGVGLNF